MKILCVLTIAFFFASCTNEPPVNADHRFTPPVIVPDSFKYPVSMVDNKKDLVCNMPVSAGIGDTAHYQGKVYGFCSTECKEAFLKKPGYFLAKKK